MQYLFVSVNHALAAVTSITYICVTQVYPSGPNMGQMLPGVSTCTGVSLQVQHENAWTIRLSLHSMLLSDACIHPNECSIVFRSLRLR